MINLSSILQHSLRLCRTCHEEAQEVPEIEATAVSMTCSAICIKIIHDVVLDSRNFVTHKQSEQARDFCRELSEFHFASCQHIVDEIID